MNEVRKLSEEMMQPVRVKIPLSDDNWEWVFNHHHDETKLISEDGEYFVVEFQTRAEYEMHLDRWCGLVPNEEVSISE
jgi:hypothetical protein